MQSYKVYFGENEVRRFGVEMPHWDNVVEMLRTIFGENYHPEMRVHYVDTEGDRITVGSEMEWTEALHHFQSVDVPLIKLWVKEGIHEGRYFKDGPPPVPIHFTKDGEVVQGMDEELERLSAAVPQGLEKLFPDGKILPYNLPHWLSSQGVFKVVPHPNDVADVDIDIEKLFHAVHERALGLLKGGKNQEGKDLFQICTTLAPKHSTAHYNLACAEALLGNSEAAIQHLVLAIENGYANLEHMARDSDLDSLRNLPDFQKLLQIRGSAVEIEAAPEPVPEAKKMEVDTVNEIVDSFSIIQSDQMGEEFPSEMIQLAEMGFHDEVLNRVTLKKTNGSIVDAVQAILGIN